MNDAQAQYCLRMAKIEAEECFKNHSEDEMLSLVLGLGELQKHPNAAAIFASLPEATQRNILGLAWFKITEIAAERKLRDIGSSN